MRKVLGWLMLVIGVSGIFLSILGIISGRQLVDAIGDSLRSNMTLTIDSLDTVRETLVLTKTTVAELETGLETATETAGSVSVALAETGPLLVESSLVVTQDVPQSIETLQDSMPGLIEVSGAIDSTLRTLSGFAVSRTILGIPLSFDLGVEYDPDIPFDQSVRELGASLEGMPQQLRGLEDVLDTTNENLQVISQDLGRLGADLEGMNANLDEVGPLIDEYINIVTEIGDNTRQSRSLLAGQLQQAKLVLTLIMIWFGLLQIAPIYLGWELIHGRRETEGAVVESEGDVIVEQEVVKGDGDDA